MLPVIALTWTLSTAGAAPATDPPENRRMDTITIHNTGQVPAQLIARHWLIHDAQGHAEEVKGLGVVGKQPLLRPGESFQYTSGCRLRTTSGTMHGRYFCITEDAEHFEVPIPLFVLDAQTDSHASPRTLH